MGNGIQLAGIAAKSAAPNDFGKKARHFNAFGGSPVSFAAGLAVLNIFECEALMQNDRMVGNCLMSDGRDSRTSWAKGSAIHATMLMNVEGISVHDQNLSSSDANSFGRKHCCPGDREGAGFNANLNRSPASFVRRRRD